MGGTSAIGGVLYRPPAGAARPFTGDYDGDYFFSDYYVGFLRRLKGSGASWSIAPRVPGQADPADWATGLKQVTDYAIGPDGSLWYCRQIVPGGPNGDIRRIVRSGTVDVANAAVASASTSFSTPYPSPSTGAVHLTYVVREAADVELALFDLAGRLVRRLVTRGRAEPGVNSCTWDGRDDAGRALPAGIYRAVLTAGASRLERRAALVR